MSSIDLTCTGKPFDVEPPTSVQQHDTHLLHFTYDIMMEMNLPLLPIAVGVAGVEGRFC